MQCRFGCLAVCLSVLEDGRGGGRGGDDCDPCLLLSGLRNMKSLDPTLSTKDRTSQPPVGDGGREDKAATGIKAPLSPGGRTATEMEADDGREKWAQKREGDKFNYRLQDTEGWCPLAKTGRELEFPQRRL